jgi:hypothetical protein
LCSVIHWLSIKNLRFIHAHAHGSIHIQHTPIYMAVCQNLVPLVNIKIAGKWMFIPLKMVLIGIDPYPYIYIYTCDTCFELYYITTIFLHV